MPRQRPHHPLDERFWLVWNPQGHAPTFEHMTESSANSEAQRLADQNEGQTYYVLEAVRHFRRESPVRKTELVYPVPF